MNMQYFPRRRTFPFSSLLLILLHISQINSCVLEDGTHFCVYPDQFHTLRNKSWTSVFLYGNDDESIVSLNSNSLFNIPRVNILKLKFPKLRLEPEAFQNLKNLQNLVIINSTVEGLTPDTFSGLDLNFLQLYDIGQYELPLDMFRKLPKLHTLDFRRNKVRKIDTGTFNNTPLSKIYLDNNRIENIDEGAMANMLSLEDLSLNGNKLKSFDPRLIFEENFSLNILRLNRNLLKEIKNRAFTAVPNLRFLLLGHNRLETLEDGAFENLKFLEFLDLSENHLKVIQPKVFPLTGIKRLKVLLLHRNKMTSINLGTLRRIPAMTIVSFAGNPLQCGCLEEVNQWNTEKNITEICKSMYSVDGQALCVADSQTSSACYHDLDLNNFTQEAYNRELAKHRYIITTCNVDREISKINEQYLLQNNTD